VSYGVQSADLFGSTSQPNGSTSTSLRPFSNLDLTEDQRKQIRSILKTGNSQGLSQSEIQQQINAVLTPTQQTTLQTDLANRSSSSSSGQDASSTNDPLANLGLTDDQKSQIDTILQNAQADGTSQSDVLAQINAALTPTQQSAFLQDVQTAQAIVSGQSQNGNGGTSSTATLSSGVTETDIQNQVAAATSLILQQFQHDVATTA
jgi:Spy/CpxP family protein refolding chaperone